ncbi:MAG: DUF4136 domain-containing protein [Actinomycetota bacterium]|nr:DUF4136 domain-containing protein [Actinomycetota bacterium]
MDRIHTRERGLRRMGRSFALLVACSVAFVHAGCSTLKVHSDWDPEYDFSRVQTWKWATVSQTPTGSAVVDTDGLLAQRVMRAVETSLAGRGYVKTETSEGDFEVAWFLTVEPKTQVTTINDYHGYGGPYRGWYGAGYGGSTTVVDSYNEGTLIIDIRDGKSGQLIWRGSATARLREKADPEKAQQRANEAVTKILEKFPPPSPQKS